MFVLSDKRILQRIAFAALLWLCFYFNILRLKLRKLLSSENCVWQIAFTVGVEGNKRCRQLRDQVIQDCAYNPELLFKLLLNTSQYEFNLKEVINFSA